MPLYPPSSSSAQSGLSLGFAERWNHKDTRPSAPRSRPNLHSPVLALDRATFTPWRAHPARLRTDFRVPRGEAAAYQTAALL